MNTRSKSGRGLLQLLTGTVGAQLLTFAALPLISRLYSPESFGQYSLVLSLAAIATPLATLRLESATLLPQDTSHVRSITGVALGAILVIGVVYSGAVFALSSFGVSGLNVSFGLAVWIFVFTVLMAVFELLTRLTLRKKLYSTVATRTFLRSAATVAPQLGLSVGPAQAVPGLLIGALIGHLAGLGVMVKSTKEFLCRPRLHDVRTVWRRYWRFPVVFAPSALLNAFGLQLPLVFFIAHFGIGPGGQVGMADKLISVPVTLVAATIGQVFAGEAADRIRSGGAGVNRLFLRFSALLAAGGLVVGVAAATLAESVLPWILGSQWTTAGMVVQTLALNAAIRLVASPLSQILILLEKSLLNTILDVIRAVLMVISFSLVTALSLSLTQATFLVYTAMAVTYFVTWVCCAVLAHKADPGKGKRVQLSQ